jgi:hypothetical protein
MNRARLARAMTLARPAALAVAAALAVGLPARAARGDATESLAVKPAAARMASYPLVLLVQADAVVASEPDLAARAAGDDPPLGSDVRLRRARAGGDLSLHGGQWRLRWLLEAQGKGQLRAPLEGNRIPVGDTARVPEAFAAWIPDRAAQVSVGAMRVPISLSRQVDEADLRLPERAQIVTAVVPDFRVGAAFTSDLGLLHLRVAGMSADRNLDSRLFTSGWFGALRLDAEPLGPMGVAPWRRRTDDPWYGWFRFSAGVSVLYGTLLGPNALVVGGDGQLQWKRLTVTAEYLAERDGSGEHDGQWPRQGAVVEPGVFVARERVELVLRAAWYRRPDDRTAPTTDRTDTFAAGAGVTLFTYAARLRLQAAVELRRTASEALPDSHWGIFRATLTI